MKNFKLHLINIITLCALSAPLFSHAEDWTYSAYNKCRLYHQLGELQQYGGGQQSKADLSIVWCPLVKEVGNMALHNIYVTVEKKNTDSTEPVSCTLVQSNNHDGLYNSTANAQATVVGKKILSIKPPTTLYNSAGYAGLICNLYKDDIIYGVRYKQVN